jgi:hypothetical protein
MAFDQRMRIGRVKFPLYTREIREATFADTVSGKAEGRLSTRSYARKRLTMRDDAHNKKQRTVAILLQVLSSAGIMIAAPTFLLEKREALRACAALTGRGHLQTASSKENVHLPDRLRPVAQA